MVPKGDFAFRAVCQLDPLDAIIYAAIIREIGSKIERKRQPILAGTVFSYRFAPSISGQLYKPITGWENFWRTSLQLCENYTHVLVTDIADFYNQIYHHTIENQLDICGVGQDYASALKKVTCKRDRGSVQRDPNRSTSLAPCRGDVPDAHRSIPALARRPVLPLRR
jgi:hypothetical protein